MRSGQAAAWATADESSVGGAAPNQSLAKRKMMAAKKKAIAANERLATMVEGIVEEVRDVEAVDSKETEMSKAAKRRREARRKARRGFLCCCVKSASSLSDREQAKVMFDEVDDDASGELDLGEVKELARLMGERV